MDGYLSPRGSSDELRDDKSSANSRGEKGGIILSGFQRDEDDKEVLLETRSLPGLSSRPRPTSVMSYHSIAHQDDFEIGSTPRATRPRMSERLRASSLGAIATLNQPSFLPNLFDHSDSPLEQSTLRPGLRPHPLRSAYQRRPQSTSSISAFLSSNPEEAATRSLSPQSMAPSITSGNHAPLSLDQGRRSSILSTTPSTFTSRFDPAMLELARKEVEGDRAVFKNKEAGGPPKIVRMPTPLAGQLPTPLKKARVEGPEVEIEDEEPEVGGIEEVAERKRPPGKLYGRSLLDVLEQRKKATKLAQKQYIPGMDGRRTMMEFKPPAATQGDGEGKVAVNEVEVGRKMARSKSAMSVFGPDLLYMREMEVRKAMDEKERLQVEEEDVIEKQMWEKERLKEESKKSRKQNVSDAQRKLEGKVEVIKGSSIPDHPSLKIC